MKFKVGDRVRIRLNYSEIAKSLGLTEGTTIKVIEAVEKVGGFNTEFVVVDVESDPISKFPYLLEPMTGYGFCDRELEPADIAAEDDVIAELDNFDLIL